LADHCRPKPGGALWPGDNDSTKTAFHKKTSKRRRGFPSETNVNGTNARVAEKEEARRKR